LKIRLRLDLSFQIRQNPAPAGLEKINPVQPYCKDFIISWMLIWLLASDSCNHKFVKPNCFTWSVSKYKKAQLMLAYPRDAKTMKEIPPFRSYNKFQSSRKSSVYSN